MRLVGVTVLCALAACGRIAFDGAAGVGDDQPAGDGGGGNGDGAQGGDAGTADAPDTSGTGTMITAPGGGNATFNCSGTLAPASDFPAPDGCADWGGNGQATNAVMDGIGSDLILQPNAGAIGSASCTRMGQTITFLGMLADVSGVLTGASAQTRFEVVWSGETFYFNVQNGNLHIGAINAGLDADRGAFNLNNQHWWHIYLFAGSIRWAVSSDGANWTDLGGLTASPSGTAALRVVGRTLAAETSPGQARFASVNICPP